MKRDIAIDYLRSGVTVAVVAHHAALAYNTFSSYDPIRYMKSSHPIVDMDRFMPLDILVGWNDLFFMALMFLISGLFVAPSMARKGAGRFLAERARRLGIPFVFAAVVLGPIAYYPSWLLSATVGQGHFLARFFTIDEGSVGPAWFIWVLLVFSGIAAMTYAVAPQRMKRMSWRPRSAGGLVGTFLTASLATTIPPYLLLQEEWFRVVGPVILPALRWPLYLAWFFLGIALGADGPERSLAREKLRPWPLWLALGAMSYLAHGTLTTGRHLTVVPAWTLELFLAVALSSCCTFTGLAAIGLARAVVRSSISLADHFSDDAYGVYIFHYSFVTWLQFCLMPLVLPAAAKFLVTFSAALAASWLLTAMIRKTPAGKIL